MAKFVKKMTRSKKKVCGKCKLRKKKICTFWKPLFQHKAKRNDKACDGFEFKSHKFRDWILIRILNRNCLTCSKKEKLEKPTRFFTDWFCENAVGYDGLQQITSKTICSLYKRHFRG